jgi:hypothetical protein
MLARTLIRLWNLRLWVAIGLLVAVAGGLGAMKAFHKEVYAAASTQLLVGSRDAAISDSPTQTGALTGDAALSQVYAQLLTSDRVLTWVGRAARIPQNLIEAIGPLQVDGAPQAIRLPTPAPGEPKPAGTPKFVLNLTQNPALPVIDVYAEAPTTKQAIALANAAGTGLSAFLAHQAASGAVAAGNRVTITQLGPATGGIVDPGAGKAIGIIAFAVIFCVWCGLLLWLTRLAVEIRETRSGEHPTIAPTNAQSIAPGAVTVRTTGRVGYVLVPETDDRQGSQAAAANGGLPEQSSAEGKRSPRR